MIYLAATTDKLQVITSAAATIDVQANYIDASSSTLTPSGGGKQNTAITTAATTDVLAAPAGSTLRTLKQMTIRNKDAALACDVTVQFNQNTTLFEVHKVTLNVNDMLIYIDGVGFFTNTTGYTSNMTYTSSDQSIGASTTVYFTGSALPIATSTRPIVVGTVFEWDLIMTKTAAATATFTYDIRFGTAGTTSDTSRVAFTTGTQTAAADNAWVKVIATVRGPIGGSCIVSGMLCTSHNLAATGFINKSQDVVVTDSSAFDCTTAGMIVGLSLTTGASHAITVKQVSGRIRNI